MSALLRLYDPECNETTEMFVSDEDAERAENSKLLRFYLVQSY